MAPYTLILPHAYRGNNSVLSTQHRVHFTACVQGGNAASPRACVASYPCAVRQGLLWVWPQRNPHGSGGDGAGADPLKVPIVPELEDPQWVAQVGCMCMIMCDVIMCLSHTH